MQRLSVAESPEAGHARVLRHHGEVTDALPACESFLGAMVRKRGEPLRRTDADADRSPSRH